MKTIFLQLFGQPKIQLDNETISNWASYKALALLAYLATTRETHSRPQLEGLLWGEFEQSKAQSSLRSALYNINKLLDTPLQTGRKTAVFDFDKPHLIDVHEFRQAVAQGELQKAVALYQGDFLQGVFIDDAPEFELWVLRERENLRHEYLQALKQLIEQAEAKRQYEEAARLLRQLIHAEPWVESAHRQLMSVLARLGAYNEALRQYEQCQAVLQTELDVAPMPETTALYERILDLRQHPPQNHLPPLSEVTIGRKTEIATLTQQLANGRLHTILGAGGVGKTHLALAIGHEHARHYLDGVHFVPLAPVTQPHFLASAVANALHLTLPPNQPTHRALHDYLCTRELLLILDNAEHLLDACADFCYSLLQDAPNVHLLVTSREPLQLRQEHILSLEGLQEATAVTLFCQRAQRIQHDFTYHEGNQHAIQAICQLLAGSPLALELAAAQLIQATPDEICQQIHTNLDTLKVQWRDIPDRHRTLRAVFNESWELLTAVEQTTLAQLTVFQGGFTASAAQTVSNAPRHILTALTTKSLIRRTDQRYTLHPLVRQFASEIAINKKLDLPATQQHTIYFCQKLAQLNQADTSIDMLQRLRAEQDNIQKAWETAVNQQNWQLISDSTHGLAKFHEFTNHFQTARLMFKSALEQLTPQATQQPHQTVIAKLRARYSVMLWRTGEINQALTLAQESEQQFQTNQNHEELAFILNTIGVLHIYKGELPASITYLERCVDLYNTLNMPRHMVKPQINLGSIYMRSGAYDKAISIYETVLPAVIESNDKRGLSHIYNNLGGIYLLKKEPKSAQPYLEKCLLVCDEIRHFSVKVVALQNLGEVYFVQEAYQKALDLFTEGVPLAQELQNPVIELTLLGWNALTHHKLGHTDKMIASGRKSMVLAQQFTTSQPVLFDWLTLITTLAHELGLHETVAQLGVGILAHASEEQAKERVYAILGENAKPDESMTVAQLISLTNIWDALNNSSALH